MHHLEHFDGAVECVQRANRVVVFVNDRLQCFAPSRDLAVLDVDLQPSHQLEGSRWTTDFGLAS